MPQKYIVVTTCDICGKEITTHQEFYVLETKSTIAHAYNNYVYVGPECKDKPISSLFPTKP